MGKQLALSPILIGLGLLFALVMTAASAAGDAAQPQATSAVGGDGTAAGGPSARVVVTAAQVMTVYVPLVSSGYSLPPAFATAYRRSFSDYIFAVRHTPGGHYLIAGGTESLGAYYYYDLWILDLKPDGTIAWQKIYDGVRWNRARDLYCTAGGGFVVLAETGSPVSAEDDMWLLRLDAAGNVVWEKIYGGPDMEQPRAIRQTADGGYVLVGDTDSFGAGGVDAWVLKLDEAGGVVWQKTYGEAAGEYIEAIEQTADGGYILAGHISSYGAGAEDGWLIELDAAGSVVWQKTYGGAANEEFWAVRPTADGGYVAAGYVNFLEVGSWDTWVVKLDAGGNVTWQKTYGGPDMDYAVAIAQTGDGGYVVAGNTESFGAGYSDSWLLKLNPDGSLAWQKTYGGPDEDTFQAMDDVGDGGYVLTGLTASFGERGLWVLKVDADGSLCPSCSLGQPSPAIATASTAVTMDSYVVRAETSATILDSHVTVSDTQTTVTPVCVCPSSACRRAD